MTVSLLLYQSAEPSMLAVLRLQGDVNALQEDWAFEQRLSVGSLLQNGSLIYPASGASLTVLCPDGQIIEFLPSQLFASMRLACPTSETTSLRLVDSLLQLTLTRGGRQDPGFPYLIAPRATLVAQRSPTLRWNHLPDVRDLTVTLFGDGEAVWESGRLLNTDYEIDGNEAWLQVPILLEPDIAYSVDLCVLFADLSRDCTSDPGRSSGTNLAFYYVPDDGFSGAKTQIARMLGPDSAEGFYALALLYGQSTATRGLGWYSEAESLLRQIADNYPNHPLIYSPEYYNRLGRLYQQMSLPHSAAVNFEHARSLAMANTPAYAAASLGLGSSLFDTQQVIAQYNSALGAYQTYLKPETFLAKLQEFCATIGDLCQQLPLCRTMECEAP